MYIIVPLVLIGAALVVLGVIVWRKWPFLKKLEPDAHKLGDSFVHDLTPEAVEKMRSVHWRAIWHHGMTGAEEVLNGVRSAFTAIGHASERLRSSIQSVKESVPEPERAPEPEAPKIVAPPRDDEAEQHRLLKAEEQKLILDIAQDPKNVNLYVALGRVYAKLGNVADAIESYKTALKLDPDDDRLREKLGHLEERQERQERKAAEEAERAEALQSASEEEQEEGNEEEKTE